VIAPLPITATFLVVAAFAGQQTCQDGYGPSVMVEDPENSQLTGQFRKTATKVCDLTAAYDDCCSR